MRDRGGTPRCPCCRQMRTAYLSQAGTPVDEGRADLGGPVYHSADAQEGPAAFRDKHGPGVDRPLEPGARLRRPV